MIKEFTGSIKTTFNFSFTKFGDSELFCMAGHEGQNGDGHLYSPGLAEKLNEAFEVLTLTDNSYLAQWTGPGKELYPFDFTGILWAEYETLIPTVRQPALPDLWAFYDAIRNSPRKKIYVAPARSRPVIDLLKIDTFIEVPQFNCWVEYEQIKKQLVNAYEHDCIILFSCTMLANVLIADMANLLCTCLDVGSAFDPYCGIQNREGQMTIQEAQNYFQKGTLPAKTDMDKTYFVHIRNPRTGEYYDAYNDYFRLVSLAGFHECDIEDVQPHSDNTYIFTLNYHGFDQSPLPDIYFPATRTARYIHHQLERFNIIDDRFDQIWLYDKSMPELSHQKARYVVLGGDKNFMEPLLVQKKYDLYHMCYPYGRRADMLHELYEMGLQFAECPTLWERKNRLMQESRVGLALHQHEDSLTLIEPLRLTVFACMKLPILAEHSVNPFPYYTYSYEEFLKNPTFDEITNWQDNWKAFTEDYTFRDCIIRGLER